MAEESEAKRASLEEASKLASEILDRYSKEDAGDNDKENKLDYMNRYISSDDQD